MFIDPAIADHSMSRQVPRKNRTPLLPKWLQINFWAAFAQPTQSIKEKWVLL